MKRALRRAALLAAALITTACAARAREPLTLAKALDIARDRAPEIAAARASVRGASANVASARAGYLPTLTGSINGQGNATKDTEVIPNSQSIYTTTTYTSSVQGSASLRWAIYDFGKTGNQVAAAEGAENAAHLNIDSTVASVASDTATAYVTAAYRDELRQMARLTVTQREKLVALAHGLVKSGLQPPVEELRAASRLEAARRNLVSAETDALDASAALASLLGIEATFRVSRPRLPDASADAARATKLAASMRETIMVARATVDARNAAKDAARSRYLPTLSLTGDASWRYAEPDAVRALNNMRSATGGLVVTIPFFDASIGANVDSADADAANAAAQLELTTRDAKSDAARAAINVRGAASSVEHAKRAEEAAGTVFQLVQARYAQGLAPPTELIEAESSDADARTQRTNAELAHALGVVRLLVATGQSKRLFEEARR